MNNASDSFWLPRAGSTLAKDFDASWSLVYWVSIFFFVLVVGALAYFVVRYRRRSEVEVPDAPDHNTRLEVVWTLIPIAIVVVLFVVGFRVYLKSVVAPAEAMEVSVTAERWMWTFTYANGTVSVNELRVPRGKPVKLILSSKDVIHSFFVPELRVKKDAVPNSYTTLWFEATEPGEATIQCTEYCGAGHSAMLGKLIVQEEKDFNSWLETGGGEGKLPPSELGSKLFTKMACVTCHTTDGTLKTGPTIKAIFGTRVELADGTAVMIDEEYLRESITNPAVKVVKGFQPVMPVFKGLLSPKQIDGLVAFIKEQK